MKEYEYKKLLDDLRALPRETVIRITPLVVLTQKLKLEVEELKLQLREMKVSMSKARVFKPEPQDFERVRSGWVKAYRENPTENLRLVLKSMGVDVNESLVL